MEEIKGGCSHEGCSSCSGCGSSMADDLSFDPIVTLTDENGVDVKFEVIDVVVTDDEKEYLIVTELKEDPESQDETEVTILEIKEEDGEEVYDTVVDEKIAQHVFDIFMKRQDELEKLDELDSDIEED